MACLEGITHLADYRLFFTGEKTMIEPIADENCTYGEPDASVAIQSVRIPQNSFHFCLQAYN
jgi:hypothetical protein